MLMKITSTMVKFSAQYGMRSLLRNPRRTLITVSAVALSVAVTIISTRFSAGVMELWRKGAADTGTGHAQIHAQGFKEQTDGVNEDLTLENGNPIERILQSDSQVVASAKRLRIEGMISGKGKSIYFVGIGVEPVNEVAVSPRLFSPVNDQGSFVQQDNRFGVTIGRGLSETLGLQIGDEATLISQTSAGSVNAVDVVVLGIVNVPLPSFSKRAVYLHIEHAQRLLRLPDRYNELAIRLNDWEGVRDWVEASLKKPEMKEVELQGWWDIVPIIRDVEEIFYTVIGVICALLFVSAALSVLNMIYMMIAERTIELGTLMALGALAADLKILVAVETFMIGVMGGLLGALAGNFGVLLMGAFGVPFKNPFSSGYIDIYPTVDVLWSLLITMIGLLICVLASLGPARKASRVEPVQAFRGQVT